MSRLARTIILACALLPSGARAEDLVANCNLSYSFGGQSRNGPVLVQANEQLARTEGLWPEEFAVTRFDPLAVEFTTTRGELLFIGRIDRATGMLRLDYIDTSAARREVTQVATGACKKAEQRL